MEWTAANIFYAFGLVWIVVITPISFYWLVIRDQPRAKPDNYVGKFERPDGVIVHVARMPSGQLWVCSDERPGVEPAALGYVTGRELTTWHKLSSTPDGQERVTGPH